MDREIDGLELERVIGRGGSALVYEAYDPRHGRQVAVKVLELPGVEDRRRRAFRRELQAMGRLGDHPHVVDVFDSGFTVDGSPYLVMPLIEGGTVAQRIRDGEFFSVEQVLDFAVKIGSALETAHRRGILHCDIKPSNLFLGAFSTPLLGDLGISSVSEAGLTTTSQLSLTIMYAAPEIIENEPHSVSSDVYSLGASLFALTDMTAPFSGDSTAALIRNILSTDTTPTLQRSVPAGLGTLIADMMAVDPTARPQSALEVVHRSQALQAELGLPLTEASVTVEARDPDADPPTGLHDAAAADTRSRNLAIAPRAASKRRGLLVALLAGVLVLAAVAAAVLTWGSSSPETVSADQPLSPAASSAQGVAETADPPSPQAVATPEAVTTDEVKGLVETPTAGAASAPDAAPTEVPTVAPLAPTVAPTASSEESTGEGGASQSSATQSSAASATAAADPEPESTALANATPAPTGLSAQINGVITRTDGSPAETVEVDLFAQLPDGLRGEFLEGAFTDAAGSFVFEAPVPGCYVLTYIAPEGFVIVGGDAFLESPFCVSGPSALAVGVEIAEQRPIEAVIDGRVIRSDTFAGVLDAQVDLFVANDDGSRGAFVGDQLTDAEGRYQFGVTTGCYIVTFIAPDGLMLVGGDQYLNEPAGCLGAGDTVTVAAQVG